MYGNFGAYGGGYGAYGGASNEMRTDFWINQNVPGGVNSKILQLYFLSN